MQERTRTPDWQHGHVVARRLHDALLAVGVPETELVTLTARADESGHLRVHMPRLTVAAADLVAAALVSGVAGVG